MPVAKTGEMGRAYVRLQQLSADDSERMIAESRDKMRRDWESSIYAAEREGLRKGVSIGEIAVSS